MKLRPWRAAPWEGPREACGEDPTLGGSRSPVTLCFRRVRRAIRHPPTVRPPVRLSPRLPSHHCFLRPSIIPAFRFSVSLTLSWSTCPSVCLTVCLLIPLPLGPPVTLRLAACLPGSLTVSPCDAHFPTVPVAPWVPLLAPLLAQPPASLIHQPVSCWASGSHHHVLAVDHPPHEGPMDHPPHFHMDVDARKAGPGQPDRAGARPLLSSVCRRPGGGVGGEGTQVAGGAGKGRAVQMRFADLPASAGSAPGLPAHGGTGGYRHYCSRKRHREAGTGLWREWGWGLDSRS